MEAGCEAVDPTPAGLFQNSTVEALARIFDEDM